MCKPLCNIPKLKLKPGEWHVRRIKKPGKYHWFVLFGVLSLWAVWMAQDLNGLISGIAYTGNKTNENRAIEISGVDFVSDDIRQKMLALANSMKYQCNIVSEDVLFAFQFSLNDRTMDDHVFISCETSRVYGNAKVVHRSSDKIKCTEESNGELRSVIRSREVVIKAIDITEWKLVEYTSVDAKESCMLQHAIDVLELKWV